MPPPSKPPVSNTAGELGDRIRVRRECLDMTIEDLGHASGVHWSMVGYIERGQRNPSLYVLLRLAAGLEVDLSELVTELPPPPPPTRRKRRRGAETAD